jgi:uncharacterized protein (TIGR03435 family)
MRIEFGVLRGGWPVTRIAAAAAVVTALVAGPLTISARRTRAASAAAQASFATVWIQPSGTTGPGAPGDPTFRAPGSTLRNLIALAYRISWARVLGGPAWMDQDHWHVEAKAARSPVPYHEVRDMLKSMLRQRFGVNARFVTKQTPTIVVAFDGPSASRRLRRPTTKVDCQPFLLDVRSPLEVPRDAHGYPLCGPAYYAVPRRTYYFRSAPLDSLAYYVEVQVGRPVEIVPPIDGLFDFDLEDPPGVSPIVAPGTPSSKRQALVPVYLAALEQQLGARAELRTMPVRVLVIEGATKPRAGL